MPLSKLPGTRVRTAVVGLVGKMSNLKTLASLVVQNRLSSDRLKLPSMQL